MKNKSLTILSVFLTLALALGETFTAYGESRTVNTVKTIMNPRRAIERLPSPQLPGGSPNGTALRAQSLQAAQLSAQLQRNTDRVHREFPVCNQMHESSGQAYSGLDSERVVVRERCYSSVQPRLAQDFIRYAAINSQSHYDSAYTQGQSRMASVIMEDLAALENLVPGRFEKFQDEYGYIYVHFPPHGQQLENPVSIGISCHYDLTPEVECSEIQPVLDSIEGRDIVRNGLGGLLGADDKCGVTIAMNLIGVEACSQSNSELFFVFCPNEDIGRAADHIDSSRFAPDMLFDLDGEGGSAVTRSNFTARGFNVLFKGHDAHPARAKELGLGDATAAAATFIAYFPAEVRPENTDGLQGYIHPWGFSQDGSDVLVQTRVRYFDPTEGERFDSMLSAALAEVVAKFPNVETEIVFDGLQYENVAYSLHPRAEQAVRQAATEAGIDIEFVDERGGTTAAMFAAKGMPGGMCIFTGQHNVHSTEEYADLREMTAAFLLMQRIISDLKVLPE